MKKFLGIFLAFVMISGSLTGSFISTNFEAYAQGSSEKIPKWVKNNFIWYAENTISEDDLLTALQFLIDKKILLVSSSSSDKTLLASSTSNNKTLEPTNSDGGFFSEIKEKITDTIKIVQNDPVLDAVAKAAISEIPFAGQLLVNLYDNSKGSPEDRTAQVLALLQNYEKMNEQRLKQEFEKLEENKEEILKNRSYLESLVSDTSIILENQVVASKERAEINEKLDSLIALQKQQISNQGIGTKVQVEKKDEISPSSELLKQIDDRNKEIEKLRSQVQQLTNEKPVIDVEYLLQLANTHYYSGEPEKALNIYDEILEDNPRNADVLLYKGLILQDLGKPQEALTWYEKVLNENPRDIDAMFNMATVFYELGQTQEALTWYEKVLNENPQDVDALTQKGFIFYELGQTQESLIWIDKALQIDPNFEFALELRSIILEETGM